MPLFDLNTPLFNLGVPGLGGGGAGFVLGPANNVFGTTGSSGDRDLSTVTIAADRATAEATRDAYDTANSGWLAGYTDIDVNIILYYTDSGNPVAQYQRRIGTAWVDNGPPVEAIQGAPGSGTDFSSIPENRIPAIGPGPNFTPFDSGLEVDEANRMLKTPYSVEAGPGSFLFGPNQRISGATHAINFEDVDGETFLLIQQEYTNAGFQKVTRLTSPGRTTLNITPVSTTDLSDPQDFSFGTAVVATVTNQYTIVPAAAGTLRVQLWIGSDDTGQVAIDNEYVIEASDVGNATTLVIPNPPFNKVGDTLFARFSGIQLRGGVQSGTPGGAFDGQTLIALEAAQHIVTEVELLDAEFIRSGLATTGDVRDLSQGIYNIDDKANYTELPASFLLNDRSILIVSTPANNEKILNLTDGRRHWHRVQRNGIWSDWYYDLSIQSPSTQTRTANRLLQITPAGDTEVAGFMLDDAGTGPQDLWSAERIIQAIAAGSTPTPTPGTHDLRHGLTTQSDPALVDFGTLTDVADPTDPQTISTGTTTAGQYFHIFNSNSHPIESITDTVLQQIVYQRGGTGNIFNFVANARTESGVTYNALTIGPLNAGVDEDYVLRYS